MTFRSIAFGLLALVVLPVLAAGNAARGARVFTQCMSCHSVAEGVHLTGPSLAHAWDHKAGSAQGFQRYSEALKRSGITWNAANLDRWLADPEKLIPGNAMTFPGLKNEQDRQDVIAYLQAAAERKAPQAQGPMGGMMDAQARKPDLHQAPPNAQVKSIRYCGDTYRVETMDGKTDQVWEFNLRFKSDSSKLGPAPGKPVAVGAGMQGDRASIIFSSPKEISDFIKADCR